MENSPVLAVVGTTTIRESDVNEALLSLRAQGQNVDNPQTRQMVLDQLIEQALFLTDARKNMLEYDPAFKQQLAQLKDNLLMQFAVAKAIDRVTVSEDELKKFFDEHPEQFAGSETVAASHILVASEEEANALLTSIKAGEISFEDAAKQHSSCPSGKSGGNLGEFGRGQMVPEFDEACFSMEIGELRGPVKTQFGWHLIRLDAKNPAAPMKFSEVKDAIREHLLNEKRRTAYRSKVNQLKILYPVSR